MTPIFGRRGRAITAETRLDGGGLHAKEGSLLGVKWPHVTTSIDRALRIFDARRAAGWPSAELQLVLQVCPSGTGYVKWKKDRERMMRRSSGKYGTGGWPGRLADGRIGVLLAPYPAGRVGPALAGAKLGAAPVFGAIRVRRDGEAELGAAALLRDWMHNAGDEVALVPAPPVLEHIRGARVHSREPFDLALDWPLPPPDGL